MQINLVSPVMTWFGWFNREKVFVSGKG